VHATKAYKKSGGIVALILILGISYRPVISVMPWLYFLEEMEKKPPTEIGN
jgi:hypothetical protein